MTTISTDGTAHAVRACARVDERVRLVLRVRERGLATAGIGGMLTTKSRWIVLMDGDGQHDPIYIPELIRPIVDGEADIVSAARKFEHVSEDALSYGGAGCQPWRTGWPAFCSVGK